MRCGVGFGKHSGEGSCMMGWIRGLFTRSLILCFALFVSNLSFFLWGFLFCYVLDFMCCMCELISWILGVLIVF